MAEPHASVHALLDALPADQARAALARCCGSARWAQAMTARRPFSSDEALFAAAEAIWAGLDSADLLEAFAHHPAIGARASAGFAAQEQAQVAQAADATLDALATLNRAYHDRFGFVFLICATGRTAEEMLEILRARIDNPPAAELRIAAAEQAKITRLRLETLAR